MSQKKGPSTGEDKSKDKNDDETNSFDASIKTESLNGDDIEEESKNYFKNIPSMRQSHDTQGILR